MTVLCGLFEIRKLPVEEMGEIAR